MEEVAASGSMIADRMEWRAKWEPGLILPLGRRIVWECTVPNTSARRKASVGVFSRSIHEGEIVFVSK
jgi:hypothetical protein